MKKNKKNNTAIFLILILVFFITIIAGWQYFYNLQSKNNYLPLKIQLVNEKNSKYSINAEYPIFDSISKEFNDKIQKDINDKIKWFKNQIAENQKYRSDVTYSFNLWWEPKQLNKKYISFIIRDASFTGGANLNNEIFTYNYDLQNKKEVKLTDLFKTQNFIRSLSSYIKEDLTDQFKSASNNYPFPTDFIDTGAAPKEENFKNFVFNDDVIEFYFPKYQVAPGAYGEQKVILPRSVIIKDEEEKSTGLANPASKNCVEKGGKLEIKKRPKGEYGVCLFDENRQCEEWAMFYGDCPIGGKKITGYLTDESIYCAIMGGDYIENDDSCDFKNQKCNAKKLYDGDCRFN